jgi:FtsH-binding integral membrane protein
MRPTDLISIVVNAFFGAVTAWLIFGSSIAAIVLGLLLGIAFGFGAARANVRPGIAMTVFVGAMTGGLIGSSVVSTICLPATCVPLEITAGLVTAVASFIGVGIVAALVTRSFDEYNERLDAGLPPTGVGCEVPEE